MKVIQRSNGKWYVIDEYDIVVAGPFDTPEDAWDWIERNTQKLPKPKF